MTTISVLFLGEHKNIFLAAISCQVGPGRRQPGALFVYQGVSALVHLLRSPLGTFHQAGCRGSLFPTLKSRSGAAFAAEEPLSSGVFPPNEFD